MAVNNTKQNQQIVGFNTDKRPTGDFYATPLIAIEKLCNYEKFESKVWEPCAGNGAISKYLISIGYDVYSSDLHDWGYEGCDINLDFLTALNRPVSSVITNPPFNISYEFAIKSLATTEQKKGKVALLNRLQWLEGRKRKTLFNNYPLSKVLVFSSRLPRMNRFDYEGNTSSNMVAFAWFIFDWKYEGKPVIDWI